MKIGPIHINRITPLHLTLIIGHMILVTKRDKHQSLHLSVNPRNLGKVQKIQKLPANLKIIKRGLPVEAASTETRAL